MAGSAVIAAPALARDDIVLIRSQLIREPLGGRTWRGALTNPGDRLYAGVAIEIRFLDRNGRPVGGLGGRADRLAPGGLLELQSRAPAGAVSLRIESLRWTVDGTPHERGPEDAWVFG